jgi:hypothetical protein
MLRTFLVARLLLTMLVANDSLTGTGVGAGTLGGPWHSLLPAVFAALVLRAFEFVFLRHVLFSMTLHAECSDVEFSTMERSPRFRTKQAWAVGSLL